MLHVTAHNEEIAERDKLNRNWGKTAVECEKSFYSTCRQTETREIYIFLTT